MNTVEAQQRLRDLVADTWHNARVIPPKPPERQSRGRPRSDEAGEDQPSQPDRRDAASGWTLLIDYTDAQGYHSSRLITLIRCEDRLGGIPAIAAFCHEVQDFRLFRSDRITAMAQPDTGELIDPHLHLASLRAAGLPYINRGMQTVGTILLFLARCDGRHHPLEWEAIEQALATYALRFDGSDEDIATTMRLCRRSAPDATDFANAWIALARTPAAQRPALLRTMWRLCAMVIDADGHIELEEAAWAQAIRTIIEYLE